VTSRGNPGAPVDREAVEALRSNAKEAARLLGVKEVLFDQFPDNRFDQVPLLDVVKRAEAIIQEVQPAVIYSHHPGDLNIDHAVTFRAVLTATRPLAGCSVRDVYAFEVPSSTEWAFQRFEPAFRPNVFVDVTETIEAKVKAMETYASEIRCFPHPRSGEALRSIARRWGSVVGLEYAEAFELIRSVRS